MLRCLPDPRFSRFDTIPACERETHDDSIYRASIASRGKNLANFGSVTTEDYNDKMRNFCRDSVAIYPIYNSTRHRGVPHFPFLYIFSHRRATESPANNHRELFPHCTVHRAMTHLWLLLHWRYTIEHTTTTIRHTSYGCIVVTVPSCCTVEVDKFKSSVKGDLSDTCVYMQNSHRSYFCNAKHVRRLTLQI